MKQVVILGVALIILLIIMTGYAVSPRYVWRYLTRKKVYRQGAKLDRQTLVPGPAPKPCWGLSRVNSSLLILVTGGIGNTLLTLAAGVDACMSYGMRPPSLILETGSDFDYHKISEARFPGVSVETLSDIVPWCQVIISKSFYTTFMFFHDTKIWNTKSLEDFPLSSTVIQVTEFKNMMRVGDEAFGCMKTLINPSIMTYIERNYVFTEKCMALHLRMGQPTDDFMPPHPTKENIIDFVKSHSPDKIMVFADSRKSAEEHISGIDFPCEVEWIGDTGIVECVMIGMCSCALISHSTFSVVGCRMGLRKDVAICIGKKSCDYVNVIDPSWKIEYQDRGYQK
jgi:hypothetical protein